MSYVVAIDVGIKNLGLIVYAIETKRVVVWQRLDITKGVKYNTAHNVSYVHTLIEEHAPYFAQAHIVIVERQMRVNMKVIEAVFQSRFFDKCLIMPAQAVKMYFDLCFRNYRLNKKKAVEWLDMHWEDPMQVFISNTADLQVQWAAEAKKDDLADSMLMLLYFLDTYSNDHPNAFGRVGH